MINQYLLRIADYFAAALLTKSLYESFLGKVI